MVHLYQPDKGARIDDEEQWKRGNPGLGTIKDLEHMQALCRKARIDRSYRRTFLSEEMNVPQDPMADSIVTLAEWEAVQEAGEAEPVGPAYLGLDIGGSTSACAASLYFPETGLLRVTGAWPKHPGLHERGVGLEGAARTAEIIAEKAALMTEHRDLETRLQAAIVAEDQDGRLRGGQMVGDGETRERMALRGRVRLSEYMMAAMRGNMANGAEAEIQEAAGVQGIPIELWDVPSREPQMVVTGAPGTVGINLDPIRPAVFSRSIAARLGIDMPRVGSGTYATATISTSVTADSRAKSGDTPCTAGIFTVTTATPKRVSARLELTLEDIAAVGTGNFEAALRENLALALSAELDDQAINGDGQAPNLKGMFNVLDNPATGRPSGVL